MSWCEIIKKNDIQFETKKDNKSDENKQNIEDNSNNLDNIISYENNSDNYIIKDVNEEFDKEYSSKIIDIKIDFRDYIEKEYLPFLNILNRNTSKHNFYDFIKKNSENYKKLIKVIEKENEETLKQLENDEQKYMEDDMYEYD